MFKHLVGTWYFEYQGYQISLKNKVFWITLVLLNKLHTQRCEVASRQVLLFSVLCFIFLELLTWVQRPLKKVHLPCLKHLHCGDRMSEQLVLELALP